MLLGTNAGQERYHALVRPFYRGAKGALVVYDVTLPSSFASVKRWLNVSDGAARCAALRCRQH